MAKKRKVSKRSIRVVCVTGTPGVGKTSVCELVKQELGEDEFHFINIGDMIKEKKLYSEWDDSMNCSVFDEDALVEELEKVVVALDTDAVPKKGLLLDFHSVGCIPANLVDHVVAVRADTNILWDRLKERGYSETKIQENVQAEIFMECFSDAVDQFGDDIVIEMPNNTREEQTAIVEHLVSFLSK